MGEILGLGMTHYPPLIGTDENMAGILRAVLKDPGLPERYRDPASWPEAMRREYGNDGGTASAAAHRAELVRHFRHARKLLDEFRPEVIVMWGDDQHENFTEDVIPPSVSLPMTRLRHVIDLVMCGANVWGEGPERLPHQRPPRGRQVPRPAAAGARCRYGLLLQAAASPGPRPRVPQHGPLSRLRSCRLSVSGVAFQVNCYGRRVIAQRGGRGSLANPLADADLDPPSPTPKRCMEVGAAAARAMRESPWRTALIASSSWSHAFLTDKNHQLYPDIPADRKLYEALRAGDYETWRSGRWPRSRSRASRRCSTGTCWPAPWRRWAASPTSASSSRRGRSTPTSASLCSSHDDERKR